MWLTVPEVQPRPPTPRLCTGAEVDTAQLTAVRRQGQRRGGARDRAKAPRHALVATSPATAPPQSPGSPFQGPTAPRLASERPAQCHSEHPGTPRVHSNTDGELATGSGRSVVTSGLQSLLHGEAGMRLQMAQVTWGGGDDAGRAQGPLPGGWPAGRRGRGHGSSPRLGGSVLLVSGTTVPAPVSCWA